MPRIKATARRKDLLAYRSFGSLESSLLHSEGAIVNPSGKGAKRRAGNPGVSGAIARERILAAADELLMQRGIDGTSMRDIATAAEIQSASLYYHFPSKEELVWAVWEIGGEQIYQRTSTAIGTEDEPWSRLSAACRAHVGAMVEWRRAYQVLFVTPPWHYPEGIKDRIIEQRNRYEKLFEELISDLPLRKGVDRRSLRLMLIGSLSWALYWFKPGRETPDDYADRVLDTIRSGTER